MTELIKKFQELLETPVYAVGGCVRDFVMGNKPKDIDLCSALRPEQVINKCHEAGIWVYDVGGTKYGTVVMRLEGTDYEITTFRRDFNQDGRHTDIKYSEDLLEDIVRRDFRCNSLAMDSEGVIIDYVNGVKDIQNNVIRCTGDPWYRFREDYLRIIRMCRFAARYNWEIEKASFEVARKLVDKILPNVSIERIKMEFDKAFSDTNPDVFIKLLDEIGFIQIILPEIYSMHNFEHSPLHHPEGNVWEHTLKVLKVANPQYRWEALLHDVGKTAEGIYKFDEEKQNHSYHAHDVAGADLIEIIADRLKFSVDLTESCKTVAKMHMRPSYLIKDHSGKKAIRRFILDCRKYLEAVKQVVIADSSACRTWLDPENEKHWSPKFEQELEEEEKNIAPLIMGRDLISLGFAPGVEMGKILKDVYERQLNEEFENKDTAISFVKTNWNPINA